jgi:tetratricopeptide (TPR) repeat protein
MPNDELLERVHQLEKELNALKAVLEPPAPRNRNVALLKRGYQIAKDNWTFLTFLVGLLVGLFAWLVWGVDFFDSYRDTYQKRQLSDFYCRLGDRLMTYSEWKAAEDAYNKALEINRNNLDATHGIALAQVFNPVGEEKYYAPEVASARLEFLSRYFKDANYRVDYLKGIISESQYSLTRNQNDLKKARDFFQSSIDKYAKERSAGGRSDLDRNFVGGLVMLGYVCLEEKQLKEATEYTEKAVKTAPDHPKANSNLGYCYLLTGDYPRAIKHFENAFAVSQVALTAVNLGDVQLYLKNAELARSYHRYALGVLDDPKNEKPRLVGGRWQFHEPEMPRNRPPVYAGTLEEKRAFVHYELAFDLAAGGDLAAADKQLEEATRHDRDGQYKDYFARRARFLETKWTLPEAAKTWFAHFG